MGKPLTFDASNISQYQAAQSELTVLEELQAMRRAA